MSAVDVLERPVGKDVAQAALFDTSGKEYNAHYVDATQPLFIPNNPLHYKARRLQILLDRMENQAATNPAQFNANAYIAALNEYEKMVTQIKEEVPSAAVHDQGDLAENGNPGPAPQVGGGDASGIYPGISADNPLAG